MKYVLYLVLLGLFIYALSDKHEKLDLKLSAAATTPQIFEQEEANDSVAAASDEVANEMVLRCKKEELRKKEDKFYSPIENERRK